MFKWKGIRSSIWIVPTWEEQPKIESWMCGFSKGQRLIARDKERENVQRCVNVDKLVNETIMSIVQTPTVAVK